MCPDTSDRMITITSDGAEMGLDRHVKFVERSGAGGVATFTGTVRDNNEGRDVDYLEYDCYEAMIEQRLDTIIDEARDRWSDRGRLRIAVSHRTGRVSVGEPAVVVAVSAPHRAEALEACRYIIDELKERVPIWKKEHFANGDTWVENPTSEHGEEERS